MRRPASTSRVRGHGGTGLHGVPLRRGLLVVEVLDLFVASWRRQFPHRQWSVNDIVGATTVFPAVHVDHPDSDRSHWRLPRLLPPEPLTAYVPGIPLPDRSPLPTPRQVSRKPRPSRARAALPVVCWLATLRSRPECLCVRSWPVPRSACGCVRRRWSARRPRSRATAPTACSLRAARWAQLCLCWSCCS